MMYGRYILNGNGEPEECDDLLAWGTFLQQGDRHIGDDTIGEVRVSTVFLGLDHSFGSGPPVLWETMIFGGEHSDYEERYTSRADAEAGHRRALALVTGDTP